MKPLNILLMLAGLFPASFGLFGIDQNFFAFDGGTTPITLTGTTGPTLPGLNGVTYNDPVTAIDLSWNASPFSVTCGTGFGEIAIPKGKMHTSSVKDTMIDSCQTWALWGCNNASDPSTAQPALDTLMHYIESCAKTDPNAWGNFTCINQAAGWTENAFIYQPLRLWLESTMLLNKSSLYLCSVLNSIYLTYDLQTPSDYNDAVAIVDYINCCSPCDNGSIDSEWGIKRAQLRNSEILEYQDTVHDSTLTPIDTMEPTMHDLSLDSLTIYISQLNVQTGRSASIITNASAYPNPTGEGTVISFSTSKEAYVTLGIFDILGVQVASAQNFQNLLAAGNHAVPISLNGLPSGTYYARIMTTYGDVQTVKIVKE